MSTLSNLKIGIIMKCIASKETMVYKSVRPWDIYCYTPGITITSTGRLVLTIDLGGKGVTELYNHISFGRTKRQGIGKIFISDDQGETWQEGADFLFWHSRPFCIGKDIYIIGNAGDVCIIKSEDDGNTWTSPVWLTNNEKWHSSACNVLFSGEKLYLAMEQRFYISEIAGWNVAGLSPVVWSCSVDSDLLQPSSWDRSTTFVFRDVYQDNTDFFGVPFYKTLDSMPIELDEDRYNSPIGWLETNVVEVKDPKHLWYSPEKKCFHLFLRAHTGGSTGYACLLKAEEDENGRLAIGFQRTPSGKKQLFIPFPGGHLKFYILYDGISQLYWLVSNQSFDTMRRIEFLSETSRYGLPNNERHRLQLHFSKNCVDWCFAGMIACSANELYSRNYPSMVVVGDNLHVVCRSADDECKNPQYSNCITHYLIKEFRNLIY